MVRVGRWLTIGALVVSSSGLAERAIATESTGAVSAAITVTPLPPPASVVAFPASADLPPIETVSLSAAPPVSMGDSQAAPAASQTLVIPIQGGTISVMPSTARVSLVREGDRYTGTFGPITVTDARGSLAGWTLTATVSPPLPEPLLIRPGSAAAITGNAGEAISSGPAQVTARGTAVMSAPAGGGGGKFAVSGTIQLTASAMADPDLTVAVTFSVI